MSDLSSNPPVSPETRYCPVCGTTTCHLLQCTMCDGDTTPLLNASPSSTPDEPNAFHEELEQSLGPRARATSLPAKEETPTRGNPTDADRIEALDWLVRDANTKQVWIAQGCYCLIGIGRKTLIEGCDLRDALDGLVALQEDTADVG